MENKPIDQIVHEMNQVGYAIGKNMIDATILDIIASRVDAYYEKDHQRFGRDFLMEINELEQVRNVIEYDEIFVKLLEESMDMDAVLEALLHKHHIIHNYNLIRLFPDVKTNMLGHQWHRDVYYFGPGVRTAVNIMIPLQQTTIANGATELIPGSHLHPDLPDADYIEKNKIAAELEPGDVLFCDAATFHAAGKNTTDKPRTIIVLKYTLSFFTQQYDMCRSLPNIENYSDHIKGRLGYFVRVAENLEQFRVKPQDRRYKWPIRS
jgi:ectoine hydroxylase-related dioxygenase (phytanoyl-CoA dioxygenase family)